MTDAPQDTSGLSDGSNESIAPLSGPRRPRSQEALVGGTLAIVGSALQLGGTLVPFVADGTRLVTFDGSALSIAAQIVGAWSPPVAMLFLGVLLLGTTRPRPIVAGALLGIASVMLFAGGISLVLGVVVLIRSRIAAGTVLILVGSTLTLAAGILATLDWRKTERSLRRAGLS